MCKNKYKYQIEKVNLNHLLTNILKLLNVDVESRRHPTTHKHYSEYYTEQSINLVAQYYQDDINYFGYKFAVE